MKCYHLQKMVKTQNLVSMEIWIYLCTGAALNNTWVVLMFLLENTWYQKDASDTLSGNDQITNSMYIFPQFWKKKPYTQEIQQNANSGYPQG